MPPFGAVQCVSGPAAPQGHPAERRRDRRPHLARAGRRAPRPGTTAVAHGAPARVGHPSGGGRPRCLPLRRRRQVTVPLAPGECGTRSVVAQTRAGTENCSDQRRAGPNGRQEVAAWSHRAAFPMPVAALATRLACRPRRRGRRAGSTDSPRAGPQLAYAGDPGPAAHLATLLRRLAARAARRAVLAAVGARDRRRPGQRRTGRESSRCVPRPASRTSSCPACGCCAGTRRRRSGCTGPDGRAPPRRRAGRDGRRPRRRAARARPAAGAMGSTARRACRGAARCHRR